MTKSEGKMKKKAHYYLGNCFNRNSNFQVFVTKRNKVTCKKCLKTINNQQAQGG
jgi:hypothetical protein